MYVYLYLNIIPEDSKSINSLSLGHRWSQQFRFKLINFRAILTLINKQYR